MKSTAKTVGVVMVIMVFSRLLSLVSTSVYTAAFGNTAELNIYSYALVFPNIVFTIFGTGLTTVVIPIFAGYMARNEKERAFKFADNVTSLSMVFTAGLVLLGILIAPVFPLFTYFSKDHGQYTLAVVALRILFPVMLFYALNYILQGILQSMGRFNMPAFVSVPSSLVIIGYVVFLKERFGIVGLLVSTLVALSLQALILIPPVLKTEYRYRPSFNLKDEDIRHALRLIPPVLIGTSAYQLNLLFNVTMTARFENSVTIMSYAQNLIAYSVLAFVYSITAVVYPKLTAFAARGDMDGYKNALVRILKMMVYLLVPATVGFIAVKTELIRLLIAWARITESDITFASKALALYAVGILGVGIKEVADRAFYSIKDTKKPAYNGVVMMVVNITVSIVLIRFAGVLGIPAANSIASLFGAFLILYLLRRKIGSFGGKGTLIFILKVVAASAAMYAVLMPLLDYIRQFSFGFSLIDKGVKLAVPAAVGVLVYGAATLLLKVDQAVEFLDKIKLKLKSTGN